ncbi:MAG: alpha/beta fold hydrolase [Geminicoccaceae bacterium]
MFEGFAYRSVDVGPARLTVAIGGEGPPLLLLHGYPQTHLAWHAIAPVLAREFTVVAPDLRGYGASRLIAGEGGPAAFCKRALALDQAELMRLLGFARFAVIGHDRGARVGYRLALDRPDLVSAFVSLTVIPTIEMWDRADKAFGMGAYHWFFFAQAADLPERLVGADPGFFFDWTLGRMAKYFDRLSPAAIAAYREAFCRAEVLSAIFNDYRAGATLDSEHDAADRRAGRRVQCPVFVTWEQGRFATGETPIDIWRSWARSVDGAPIDAGHLQAEEAPDEVLAHVLPFLRRHGGV